MHQFCLVNKKDTDSDPKRKNKKDTESLLGNMTYSYIEEAALLELEI